MYQGLSQELANVMVEARSTGLFTSLCTIQQPDGLLGVSGAPSGTFTTVPGMDSIPCMAAPPSSARIQATEIKGLEDIMSLGLRHVLLDGYFPGILSQWRAVLNNINFDILGSEADSQTQMTRIQMRLASI